MFAACERPLELCDVLLQLLHGGGSVGQRHVQRLHLQHTTHRVRDDCILKTLLVLKGCFTCSLPPTPAPHILLLNKYLYFSVIYIIHFIVLSNFVRAALLLTLSLLELPCSLPCPCDSCPAPYLVLMSAALLLTLS